MRRLNWPKIFTWGFRLFAAGVLALALLFLFFSKSLPDPNRLLDRQVPESTKILDRNGQLLYEVHGEVKRTLVSLDQISAFAKTASIALEDKDFYRHGGISLNGLARSVLVDILSGSKRQGGSTITQQFVKNALLSRDKFISRKIKEIMLSLEIDARFSKDDILKLYLNEIPYGRNAYGIQAAAQTYFGTSAKDLSLAQSAYLAAMLQAPTYYNPLGPNRKALDDRKNYALKQMLEQGYINQTQYQAGLAENVIFSKTKTALVAPHFVFYVEDYLANKYGEKILEQGGLKVYTTLDLRLQTIAEAAVKDGANKNAGKYNAHNAGLVAIDPKTGQILAMAGSKDYFAESEPAGCEPGKTCTFEPNVNVATSERQPGSSFKPYVYVTAFSKDFGYGPASLLMDTPTNFGKFGDKDYEPQNYDGQNRGPVSMRQALAGSLNVPAVKTLALVGVDNTVQTARNLGITSPLADCGLSLVLGGCEVKLLDHTAAYAVLANGGVKNEKIAILKIQDKNGQTLEEYQQKSRQVLDPQAVYEITNILSDNSARSFIFGANSPLILPDRPVAAKTGTSQNFHDGWTIGFTPSLAAGVWVGNNNGAFLKKNADGVVVAAPIWQQFMKEALKDQPVEEFSEPPGIQRVIVDSLSGKLPTAYSPTTKSEIFADYAVPKTYDDVHIGVKFDASTGQVANELTPPERIMTKVYSVFHSERRDLPGWEDSVVAWALQHGYAYPPSDAAAAATPGSLGDKPQISITQPLDRSVISSLPVLINVSSVAIDQVARMDLSVDGELLSSLNQAPFAFNFNMRLPDGRHTFAVHAVNRAGLSNDTSIAVDFALNQAVVITSPEFGSLLNFPVNLEAKSKNAYPSLNFYYQKVGQITGPKLIGQGVVVSLAPSQYEYALSWSNPPPSGQYWLYAQTPDNFTTLKIPVNVP